MRDIYSKAELVFSWLGHEIDEIDIAFEAIKTIVKETWESGSQEADVEWLKKYPTWCAEPEETCDKAYLDAIRSFFDLPYWQHVWIFQELVLGQHILFVHGSIALTYEDLDRASSWFLSTKKSIDSGRIERQSFFGHYIWFRLSYPWVNIAPILRVKLYKTRAWTDRWDIFFLSSNLRATDPRDHVYGLLGLQDFAIIPDYRENLCSVLHDLVDSWMKDSNNLDCLLYAGVGTFDRGFCKDLPSWAPNFPFISQTGGSGSVSFRIGHADQGVFHTIQTPALTDSVLHTSGLLGPTVVKIHEFIPSQSRSDRRLLEFALDFVRRAPSQARGIHPLRAIFEVVRNVVKEKRSEGSAFASGEPNTRLAIGFLRWILPPPRHVDGVEPSLQEPSALPLGDIFPTIFFNAFFPGQSFEKDFLDKFLRREYMDRETKLIALANMDAQEHFRFTEMEGGYLGMAPRFSRPGDVVAIITGCKVPVILRKQEDYYILIGPSTIPGLMEGEAKELYKSGRASFEEIQIR